MRTVFCTAGMLCLLAISATSVAAEPLTLLLGGAEFSAGTSYAYLGQVASLSADASGDGLVRRVWLDWLAYRYRGDGGQTYDVSAPGAALSFGHRGAGENHWWAAYAGLSYRDSRISPTDPSSTVSGGMLRPQFQLEGEQKISGNWAVGTNASYINGEQAYWVRGRVLRDAWQGRQIGLEAVTQGDPTYRARQLGVVLAGLKAGSVDVGLTLGVRQVEGLSSQAYFGIELGSVQ